MAIVPDFSGGAPEGMAPEAPETRAPESPSSEAAPDSPSNTPDLLELDKHERFKLDGKEWTRKDLTASIMRQSDYTRKTQEIAEERKYYDNLNHDLAAIRENPALEAKFREIYPEKFHQFLDYVRAAQPAGKQEPKPEAQLDPKIASRIDQLEKLVTEDKVTALEAKLEVQDQKFSSKYPMADIEAVYARAQAEHSKGNKLSEAKWEELWKADHERHQKRYEAHYKKQVETQKAAIRKSKDMGPGGGTPGQAPKKTMLKNVAEEYLASNSG